MTTKQHLCRDRDGRPILDDYDHPIRPRAVQCNACRLTWCERCDPAPAALCHRCHGRGYTTAGLPREAMTQPNTHRSTP